MGVARKELKLISPQLDVTSSGTPERLSSSDLWVYSCMIEAHHNNDGVIYIGDSSANALNTNDFGTRLEAGDRFCVDLDFSRTVAFAYNLKEVWFDGSQTGDKIIVWITQ